MYTTDNLIMLLLLQSAIVCFILCLLTDLTNISGMFMLLVCVCGSVMTLKNIYLSVTITSFPVTIQKREMLPPLTWRDLLTAMRREKRGCLRYNSATTGLQKVTSKHSDRPSVNNKPHFLNRNHAEHWPNIKHESVPQMFLYQRVFLLF